MGPSEDELRALAVRLGDCLQREGLKLAAAESCTGGWLSKIVTDIAGSSAWFAGSVVCYSNELKHALLGVNEITLIESGAVSGDTVLAMSDGLFARTDADVVVSISGVAGPGGGTDDKPVGLVWLSWGKRDKSVFATPFNFEGDRDAVRRQSVAQAFNELLDLMACQ